MTGNDTPFPPQPRDPYRAVRVLSLAEKRAVIRHPEMVMQEAMRIADEMQAKEEAELRRVLRLSASIVVCAVLVLVALWVGGEQWTW